MCLAKQALILGIQLDLILPEEVYELCQQELDGDIGTLRYARVNMTLLEVLSGDFFTQYIKKGMHQCL